MRRGHGHGDHAGGHAGCGDHGHGNAEPEGNESSMEDLRRRRDELDRLIEERQESGRDRQLTGARDG